MNVDPVCDAVLAAAAGDDAEALAIAVENLVDDVGAEGAVLLLADASRAADAADDTAVLEAACLALGALWDPAAATALEPFVSHEHPGVRSAAVQSLPNGQGLEDDRDVDPLVVDLLASRHDDPDPAVRAWALFGLGTNLDVDTPAVRTALGRGLLDDEADVRAEAVVGLARRGDVRTVAMVREMLAARPAGRLAFEAAEALADPSLATAVREAQPDDDVDPDLVARVVERCDGTLRERFVAAEDALFTHVGAGLGDGIDTPFGTVAVYAVRLEGTFPRSRLAVDWSAPGGGDAVEPDVRTRRWAVWQELFDGPLVDVDVAAAVDVVEDELATAAVHVVDDEPEGPWE